MLGLPADVPCELSGWRGLWTSTASAKCGSGVFAPADWWTNVQGAECRQHEGRDGVEGLPAEIRQPGWIYGETLDMTTRNGTEWVKLLFKKARFYRGVAGKVGFVLFAVILSLHFGNLADRHGNYTGWFVSGQNLKANWSYLYFFVNFAS